MSDDPRVRDLLLRWEDARDRGAPVAPEELCRDCPELLEPLARRVEALRQMDRVLDVGPDAPTVPGRPATDPFMDFMEGREAEALPPAPPGYEVLAEVDHGGMGVVYKARQVALDRVVAIKMIRAGPQARPENVARFQTEARAVARLAHPNVVQVHDVGRADGNHYLVLEYLEGGDLETALGDQPLPPDEAAALTETLARAVQHCHDHGVVHRDLKPSNVLLTSRDKRPDGRVVLGTPKLADFGLARLLSADQRLTRPGTVLGTPAYMSPEQARGTPEAVGPSADVYGLGATFYHLLTGGPPFEGDEPPIEQVLRRVPDPPSRRCPGVPAQLDAICLRCLRKDPAQRYPSAGALADALRRYLDCRAARPARRAHLLTFCALAAALAAWYVLTRL